MLIFNPLYNEITTLSVFLLSILARQAGLFSQASPSMFLHSFPALVTTCSFFPCSVTLTAPEQKHSRCQDQSFPILRRQQRSRCRAVTTVKPAVSTWPVSPRAPVTPPFRTRQQDPHGGCFWSRSTSRPEKPPDSGTCMLH
jgi:hypothetical protein